MIGRRSFLKGLGALVARLLVKSERPLGDKQPVVEEPALSPVTEVDPVYWVDAFGCPPPVTVEITIDPDPLYRHTFTFPKERISGPACVLSGGTCLPGGCSGTSLDDNCSARIVRPNPRTRMYDDTLPEEEES